LTSVFIYTMISCAIFWFVYSKRESSGTVSGYSAAELIPFYAVTRLVPLFMYEDKAAGNFAALAVDAAVLGAVCLVSSKASRSKSTAAAVYMFCPLPVICMTVGTVPAVIINIAAVTLVLGWMVILTSKYPLVRMSSFTGSLALAGTGIYLAAYGILVQDFSLKELTSDSFFPAFITAGLILTVSAVVLLVFTQKKITSKGWKEPERKADYEEISYKPEKFGAKNVVHIVVLTALYAAAVLFQLGSHEAPSTGYMFNSNDSENSEVIIDLGEYKTVSSLQIFLGQESLRTVSLSAYNETSREWESIRDEELKTAFAWNEVSIGWNLRYLGIVFPGSDTHFNEIILLDQDKNIITPVNTAERPYLFDEQEMFPEEATYYYRMMFDEIYHGRTGYEFLHNLSIYENTHPPLGKTLIAGGIAVFGMNPFGWRIVVALFGTLMIPVMYMFAWKISHRSSSALAGGVLFATEFMNFTLSRIATIDIIVAAFILLMFLLMYCFIDEMNRNGKFSKQVMWLVLCGLSTGLAMATKWTGIYAAGGIAVLFFTFLVKHCAARGTFRENLPYLIRLCIVCVASFIVIPLVIYSLSYFEFVQSYPDKNIIQHAIENGKSMLSYHSSVTDSHPYQSEWYQWITVRQPLLDAVNTLKDNKISSVSTFANPLTAYAGLAAFFHNIYLWRCRKNIRAQYLSVAYIAMLMPWLFIHRTVFIYQYFGCMLIIILLICNSILNLRGSMKKKEYIMMALSLALFIMFFPQLSGVAVDRSYTKHFLELVPTWIFE